MKKKILIITIIAIFTIFLTSCAYKKSSNDNKNNGSESIQVNKDTSENIGKNTGKDLSKNIPPKNTESNIDNLGETNTENGDNYKVKLLNNIKNKSQNGMVINSEFKAKDDVIDRVNNAYGKEDTENYIAEAKGVYYTFESKNLAFGCNKGAQIFEVRSFDKSLKELSLQDIISYFGKSQYEVVTDLNERIIGYKVNDDFKLLFVFSDSEDEKAILDHYSVLYPRGTVNSMADDPGREW
ncbi:YjgB family protein [Clostridium tertium]|mgnify:FL=1|jgi:hypothetical protein|uniref:YjgB family protein n=1 Tax=Clostridium tertium TaxID=1559 RepID=UPI00356832C8